MAGRDSRRADVLRMMNRVRFFFYITQRIGLRYIAETLLYREKSRGCTGLYLEHAHKTAMIHDFGAMIGAILKPRE